MRLDPKKHKRTPSFTTRRRTQSFRRHTKNLNTMQNLPPVEMDGFLDRKQELQSGGKRATIRSWKSYYTVLCGQLMCFFRDQEDFFESKAASSPIMIYQASVELANDYTKRNFVFRLHVTDGSEFLFGADNEEQQEEWVKKIKFHAGLPPSQQLTSYKSTIDEERASQTSADSPPMPEKENTSPENTEPLYANIPMGQQQSLGKLDKPVPPLPDTQPPPQGWGTGASGAREVLKSSSRHSLTTPGSREPLSGVAPDLGPLPPAAQAIYANVGQQRQQANTLPAQQSRHSIGTTEPDSVEMSTHSAHSKEKRGSVLGRFLGRKKL